MKKIKLFFAFMGVFALLFYACSKDENNVNPDEKATLSFGAIVQDLANKSANKQEIGDIPACSDDDAAYVEIILMQGDQAVVGAEGAPFRVDLVSGQVFTEEVPELELDPGTYSLEHFAVYNEGGELIWLAPKGGVLADFVDNALPLSINLGAGVKKYVDVSVLCYDDRDVNQYGYLFFELDATEAVEFCFFANYCPPGEDGKHYTANYSVNIWWGTDATGTPLYTGVTPVTGVNEDGDYFAEPACFVLPDNDDLNTPYLYYEVTLLDWPDNYGTVAPGTVISGTLTAQDIMDNFDGENNVNYEHLRFNCDGETPPPGDDDDDGVPNDDDNCPLIPNPDQANSDDDSHGDACDNCPLDTNEDQADTDEDGVGDECDICPGYDDAADMDEDGIPDDCDNCPNVWNPTQLDTDGDGEGNACDQTPGGDNGGDTGDVVENCETAIMYGDTTFWDLGLANNRWGWAEHVGVGEDGTNGPGVYQIWAAAGQNDLEKGYWVGNVTVTAEGDEYTIELEAFEGNEFSDIHVYIGEAEPTTSAPGQFDNTDEDGMSYSFTDEDGGGFWLIVHVQACPAD
ncbi:Thrombospondin type 3 repeat-containing protein [Salinimicrobium catena]|uniref:Thrombospondin type 3 repeat-containing protein n=2 Tax=Salinimicrobium catena TaxID=390640 RepID=A0A1H5LH73_9FLAO|nr:Thrombospondin type 3 repeat-containing protein [Salinimicrobium catena]SEE76370.1 Thrombospondin type 3 repeat-containing protein [Salinimicrobium catena]